jgi:hypothetical protein
MGCDSWVVYFQETFVSPNSGYTWDRHGMLPWNITKSYDIMSQENVIWISTMWCVENQKAVDVSSITAK